MNHAKRRDWLITHREEQSKLTQEEVAAGASIARAYYAQIELGVRNPSVSVAKRIAGFLGFNWTLFFEMQCSEKEQSKKSYLRSDHMAAIKRKKRRPKTSSQELCNVKSAKLDRLIAERKKRKLSQSDIASMLGVSTATISHLENGRQKPSLELALGLQQLFNLPYETLFPDY